MKSSIVELENDIIDNKDILSILRKALVISKELGLKEFSDWIDLELNGYDYHEVPDYRIVECDIRGDSIQMGMGEIVKVKYAPVKGIPNNILEEVMRFYVYQSIPEIINICKTNDKIVKIQNNYDKILQQNSDATEIYRIVPIFKFETIINKVENNILDWCSELKNKGIIGEDYSFTEEEKDIAKNIQYNVIISNSQIQVGNNNLQLINIFPKEDIETNLDAMINILKEYEIEEEISTKIKNNVEIIKNETDEEEPNIEKIEKISNTIKELIKQIGINMVANLLLNHIINIIIIINTYQSQLIN